MRRVRLCESLFMESWVSRVLCDKSDPNQRSSVTARSWLRCDCATATELVLADACGVTAQTSAFTNDRLPEALNEPPLRGAIINLDAGGDMFDTLDVALEVYFRIASVRV